MKNPENSMPLYYQIVTDIKRKIVDEQYLPGDKLPTEKNLSSEYKVSRVTVRNALKALTELGYVEQQPYKGYFVSRIQRTEQLRRNPECFSFYEDLKAAGHKPGSKIISMTTIKAGSYLSSIFHCDKEEPMIELHRIRLADGVPFADEVNYMKAGQFSGINPWDLENRSLISVMEKDFGVMIAYCKQTLRAKRPTKEQKEWLNIKGGEPHLSVHSRAYDKDGNMLKYTKVLHRTDIIEYSFTWSV